MMNELNNFDRLIKNSFEDFDVPYNPDHWKDMQQELNSSTPSMTSYFGAITSGLAAVGVVFIIMLFFVSDTPYSDYNVRLKESPEENYTTPGQGDQHQIAHTDTSSFEKTDKATENAKDEKEVVRTNENTGIAQTLVQPSSVKKSTSEHMDVPKKPAIAPVKNIKGKSSSDEAPHVRTGCTGLVINFTASEEYGADAKYLWNFGDGFFSNERNPSHTFNKEGTFDVSLSVTSKKTGQISSNVVQAMIEVVEAPTANMVISVEGPKEIKVKNDSFNAGQLAWSLNNTPIIDKNEINISVADNTRQNLAMNVSNESGCSDSLEILINTITAGTEFPRTHTRNSGSPFAPGAILNKGNVTSINIYNQSSRELVFTGSGNKGWNGNDLNGNPVSSGQFDWIMVVEKQGIVDVYKGSLELK